MRFASSLAILVSAAVFGCTSSSSPGSSCQDYTPPADFDATKPVVSFSKNVLPIFDLSCAFSTCHGSTTGTANGVFLGRDPARVYAAIINMPADELKSMAYVKPGTPRDSYLMRKLDASQCALDAQCTNGTCQQSMPQNAPTLDIATRDVVRRWIAQGAPNN